MRVLHVASHLDIGGIAQYVLVVSQAMAQRGHGVVVASGGGALSPAFARAGVALWGVPLRTSVEFSPSVWRASSQLARCLQQEPVDLLHAHTRVGQVVADRLSRRLRVPYVTTWHGFYRWNLGRRLWPCTGQRTIAISPPVRDHLQRAFGVPTDRLRLIPHGIDVERFSTSPDPTAQQELRDRLGLAPGDPVVGTIARLVASKGIDRLIRSLPAIRLVAPATRLLIVGDGEERSRLEALAREQGVGRAVHFAGTLPDTHAALSLMDVFVFLPAEREGFGLSLLEAMAARRPIVAVRQGGGATWVLDESRVGLAVEPDDPVALARAILHWLHQPDAARAAGEDARAVVSQRYSLTRMVEQIEAVYREVLSERR